MQNPAYSRVAGQRDRDASVQHQLSGHHISHILWSFICVEPFKCLGNDVVQSHVHVWFIHQSEYDPGDNQSSPRRTSGRLLSNGIRRVHLASTDLGHNSRLLSRPRRYADCYNVSCCQNCSQSDCCLFEALYLALWAASITHIVKKSIPTCLI
jgi:hypothetical protein